MIVWAVTSLIVFAVLGVLGVMGIEADIKGWEGPEWPLPDEALTRREEAR